jgi:hypothetical protein
LITRIGVRDPFHGEDHQVLAGELADLRPRQQGPPFRPEVPAGGEGARAPDLRTQRQEAAVNPAAAVFPAAATRLATKADPPITPASARQVLAN